MIGMVIRDGEKQERDHRQSLQHNRENVPQLSQDGVTGADALIVG
jgi:hypothetical protein